MWFLETVLQGNGVWDNLKRRVLVGFNFQPIVLFDLNVCAGLLRHIIKQQDALVVVILTCKPTEEARIQGDTKFYRNLRGRNTGHFIFYTW